MTALGGRRERDLKGCLPRAAAAIQNVKPGDRFPPNCDVHHPIGNDRSTSILLKKSETRVQRKSRFRAHSVACTGSCHSEA